MSDDAWVIVVACLVSVSCGLSGVFLVLRRMAMLGDAISHSVLFGIVVAFLLAQSRSPLVMFVGASAVGVLTAYMTSMLSRQGELQEDASIGVTFTTLFALGVILISVFAGQVDLDQDCVLYGEIAFVPFDRILIDGSDFGPRSAWMSGVALLISLLMLLVGYRRLSLLSFDPLLAHSLGVSGALWHYVSMTVVSLTSVASFDAVGAILVVAMLVIPPATAYIFASSVLSMILMTVVVSLLSAMGGWFLAASVDASISGAIATVAGILFLGAAVFDRTLSVLRRKAQVEA